MFIPLEKVTNKISSRNKTNDNDNLIPPSIYSVIKNSLTGFRNIILIILASTVISSCVSLSEPGSIYKNALSNVKEKNFDSAFMNLRELARDYPNSPYSRNARFAMAEYLFTKKDYYDSLREFVSIIEDFPNTSQALFAKAIVYKALSEFSSKEIEGLSSKIKREFFAQPIILVFSEYKTKSFKTLLGSHYTIKDYVDRVEIFKDNEIFLKITP